MDRTSCYCGLHLRATNRLAQVPDNMRDEDAAGFGIPTVTCGQALYLSLKLPLPGSGEYGGYLLVYGGSTGVGMFAIQFGVL